jgi:serine/threonine-protein kinase
LQVGSTLAGRYRILQHLGDGAMGSVYLGEHLKIGRKDAIKVLRDSLAGEPEAMARFVRGARGVSRIRHENVCTIYDFSDTAEGVQFLAMEYIPGLTLRELLTQDGTLPLERAVPIAVQAAGALQAAHDAGIVHRDLKPANIMLMRGRDGSDIVKVVDFDIAKAEDDGTETEVTRFGFVVGTPEYMSPEQLTGESLDGRSDVYSLALVVYRMLTGLLPFPVETTREMLLSRLTRAPIPLQQALPDRKFPESIQRVLDWALQRDPADRVPTAAAFGKALAEAAASVMPGSAPRDLPPTLVAAAVPGHGEPTVALKKEPKPPVLSRKLMIGAAATIAGLGIALTAWTIGNNNEDEKDPNALIPTTTAETVLTGTGNESTPPNTVEYSDKTSTPVETDRPKNPDNVVQRDPVIPDRVDPDRSTRPLPAIDPLLSRLLGTILLMPVEITANQRPQVVAIRDTARRVLNESDVTTYQIRAAQIIASAQYRLKDFEAGAQMASRALRLCVREAGGTSPKADSVCRAHQALVDQFRRNEPQ